jgi:predicted nucleic-acid-binding protein
VLAETVSVLESYYRVERADVAAIMRTVVASPAVAVDDALLALRAIEIYEVDRLDFADADLVASAERRGVTEIVSFDRALDRVPTITRIEPA